MPIGSTTGCVGTGAGVDVVAYARHLGMGSAEEVWDHVIKSAADVGQVLDAVAYLMRRVAEYPDDGMSADLSSAFKLVEGVGEHLLNVARATHTDR
ncbi:hypothetical protein [Aquipuribacter hungaricus]|uniref:Uncharacterized protein n=1 Tax=Aquipuribacter hungaricus TaxID=545624 RepID=A0ABV7WKQ7_9MICO